MSERPKAKHIPVAAATEDTSIFRQKDGYKYKETKYKVPLDYANANDSKRIDITVRIVYGTVADKNAKGDIQPSEPDPLKGKKIMAYLCGGPGSTNPIKDVDEFNEFCLGQGYCVLYMDHRGTGDSTEFVKQCFTDELRNNTREQVRWMKLLLQDNIARDHEAVRQAMRVDQFALWGQSFGGFIAYSYLSLYPFGGAVDVNDEKKIQQEKPPSVLEFVVTTAGVPPALAENVDEVFRETYLMTSKHNETFYDKHAEDKDNLRRILRYIVHERGNHIAMPDNEKRVKISKDEPSRAFLTGERFLSLGRTLGTTKGYETVHKSIEMCIGNLDAGSDFTVETLNKIDRWLRFEERPLYGLLQEAIYMKPGQASNHSASRVGQDDPHELIKGKYWWLKKGELARLCSPENTKEFDELDIYMAGEHVYDFHFDQFNALMPFKAAYEELSQTTEWPILYNENQLKRNKIPTVSRSFEKDMFVSWTQVQKVKEIARNVIHDVDKDREHNGFKKLPQDVVPVIWNLLAEKNLVQKLPSDFKYPGTSYAGL